MRIYKAEEAEGYDLTLRVRLVESGRYGSLASSDRVHSVALAIGPRGVPHPDLTEAQREGEVCYFEELVYDMQELRLVIEP